MCDIGRVRQRSDQNGPSTTGGDVADDRKCSGLNAGNGRHWRARRSKRAVLMSVPVPIAFGSSFSSASSKRAGAGADIEHLQLFQTQAAAHDEIERGFDDGLRFGRGTRTSG